MLLVTWDSIVNETNLPICAVFVIVDSLIWKSSCRLSVPSHVHRDCSLASWYPCAGSPSNIAFNSGRFWTGLGFFSPWPSFSSACMYLQDGCFVHLGRLSNRRNGVDWNFPRPCLRDATKACPGDTFDFYGHFSRLLRYLQMVDHCHFPYMFFERKKVTEAELLFLEVPPWARFLRMSFIFLWLWSI